MEFDVDEDFSSCVAHKDAIMLACVSNYYFKPYINQTGANPIVWPTSLMSTEGYTLKATIDGWICVETVFEIRERAAAVYDQYQKCGIQGLEFYW